MTETDPASIPKDLRLQFLLKNRATIDTDGRRPIKDAAVQHIDITRAIFFYRFDDAHQFQRYHDTIRWNIAIFVALLTASDEQLAQQGHNQRGEILLVPAARAFVIAYLAAVLEHVHNPTGFVKRDEFIKMWKQESFEFFFLRSAQKKMVKQIINNLRDEWKSELEAMRKQIGAKRYETEVAKFVGVWTPGHYETKTVEQLRREHPESRDDHEEGVFLRALQAPEADTNVAPLWFEDKSISVANQRKAIHLLGTVKTRQMLAMLMRLFSENSIVSADSTIVPYEVRMLPTRLKPTDQNSMVELPSDAQIASSHGMNGQKVANENSIVPSPTEPSLTGKRDREVLEDDDEFEKQHHMQRLTQARIGACSSKSPTATSLLTLPMTEVSSADTEEVMRGDGPTPSLFGGGLAG